MPVSISNHPTAKEISQWVRYEVNTGKFYWTRTQSNRVRIGSEAGCKRSDGYVKLGIMGKYYYAHRLAWIVVHGDIPDGKFVDHIDGLSNCISNLRLADVYQNQHNSKIPVINTSGFKGVCFNKKAGRYMARIKVRNQAVFLGMFDCPTAGHIAYLKAARVFHKEFARAA